MTAKVQILTDTGAGLKWTVPADWNNSSFSIIALGGGQNGTTPNASNGLNGFGGGSGWIVQSTKLPAANLVPGQMLDFKVASAKAGDAGATVVTPAVNDLNVFVDNSSGVYVPLSSVTWAAGNDSWIKDIAGNFIVFAPGGRTNDEAGQTAKVINFSGQYHSGSNGSLNSYLYSKNQFGLCSWASLVAAGQGSGGAGAPGDPYFTGLGWSGGSGGVRFGNFHPINDPTACATLYASVIGADGTGGGAGVTGVSVVDPDGPDGETVRTGSQITTSNGGTTSSLGGTGGTGGLIDAAIDGSNGLAGGAYYVATVDATTAGPGGGGGGGAGGCVISFDTGSFSAVLPTQSHQKTDVSVVLYGAATGGKGGNGGKYGAGGGGGANAKSINQVDMGIGGTGAQGAIIIRWTPADIPAPVAGGRRWRGTSGPIRKAQAAAAPVIISDGGGPTATVNIAIGATAVTIVIASGVPHASYAITGGANAGLFAVDSKMGQLSLRAAQAPGNYIVEVTASNSQGSDSQIITAHVASLIHGVHFDGSTWLKCNSLVQTDAKFFAMFFWILFSGSSSNKYIWSSDPANFATFLKFSSAGVVMPQYLLELFDPTDTNGIDATNATTVPFDSNWHSVLIGADLNHGVGAKKVKVLFDGVDRSNSPNNLGVATNLSLNGTSFFVGQDGFGGGRCDSDLAQFWYAPINLLDGSGNIPAATQQLFVNGGLAQPSSGFPAGAVVLLDGDASSFGNNQGSGGAFAVTGALTNSSTSPPQ